MTSDTTIHVRQEDVERLDNAAEALFGTTEVPRRVTVDRLLADHEPVPYDGQSGDEE